MMCDRAPAFPPGSDHRYSNSNFVVLGLIAERATGRHLADLFRDEIFEVLSLHDTYFLPSESVPPQLVAGYDRDLIPLPGWQQTSPDNTAWSSAAYASGGMASTASDVMRFFGALSGGELLGDSSYREMTTFEEAAAPADHYLEEFGLGLFSYGDFFGGAYGHLGLFVGSEAIALFHPDGDFALVLLANVSRIRDKDGLVQKYLNVIVP
jgi:D-alanyl-D-alanine carboxypeptidase